MAPGVSAGSRRTRGAITVSQPAGQRPGHAGAAAGPGRGPGRAVPSAEGGGRAGAKVIPPPLLAGSPAPSAPLYPLPGASLASPPASLLRLAVPPHSAACPGPLHAAFPHTPRDRPAAAAGSGLGGPPPAAPPPSGPGRGRRAPRGAAGEAPPPGRPRQPQLRNLLPARPGGAGPPRPLSPHPGPDHHQPPPAPRAGSPRRPPRSSPRSLARQPAGAAGRAGVRLSGGGGGGPGGVGVCVWWGGHNRPPAAGEAPSPQRAAIRAGAARRGRPGPAGGGRRPRRPLAAFAAAASSFSSPPRVGPRRRPAAAAPPRPGSRRGGGEGRAAPGRRGRAAKFLPFPLASEVPVCIIMGGNGLAGGPRSALRACVTNCCSLYKELHLHFRLKGSCGVGWFVLCSPPSFGTCVTLRCIGRYTAGGINARNTHSLLVFWKMEK